MLLDVYNFECWWLHFQVVFFVDDDTSCGSWDFGIDIDSFASLIVTMLSRVSLGSRSLKSRFCFLVQLKKPFLLQNLNWEWLKLMEQRSLFFELVGLSGFFIFPIKFQSLSSIHHHSPFTYTWPSLSNWQSWNSSTSPPNSHGPL